MSIKVIITFGLNYDKLSFEKDFPGLVKITKISIDDKYYKSNILLKEDVIIQIKKGLLSNESNVIVCDYTLMTTPPKVKTIYELVEKEVKNNKDPVVTKNAYRYLRTYRHNQSGNDSYGRELYRKLKYHHSRALVSENNQLHVSPGSIIWTGSDISVSENFVFGYSSPPNETLPVQSLRGSLKEVLLPPLEAGQIAYYQIGNGPIKTFRSCPQEGYHLLALGDVGLKYPASQVFKTIKEREASGLLICGDLSYADGDEREWDDWFQMISPVVERVPMITAVGNHEGYDTDIYLNRVYPHKMYYSVDYPLSTIISLSSEEDYYSSRTEQYIWLENTLSNIDRELRPWIIVIFHKPFYCSNETHHNSAEDMREGFEPLFIKYGVNLVLAGHVHAYERTAPLRDFQVVDNSPVYLTVGTGGASLDESWERQPDWSLCRFAEYGFVDLLVERETISGKFIAVDGAVYDTFTLEKRERE